MIDVFKRYLVGLLILCPMISFGQLNAEFSADTTFGCGSLGVQFTDQSTGNILSRSWTFGNGNTSSLTNPFENYGVGTYTVSLTVSDGVNSDTETKTAYIRVFSKPTANFTFNPTTGCSPLPVQFTSTSSQGGGAITNYIWDMDDGSQSPNAASFIHTYAGGGPYNPTLQIIDVNGCSDTKSAGSTITPTASPVASFISQASPVGCSVPFVVDFISTSTGGSLSYNWNFGDGNTSTQANPSHTYTALGNYTVRLIVSDPNCSDTIIRTDFVRVNNTVADFTFTNDTVCFGLPLSFTNLSVGANNFSWDFDDGSSRRFAKDPNHTFLDTGWFDVTMVASIGSSCTDQIIKQIYVEFVEANFSFDPILACELPDTIQFTDSSFRAFRYDWRIQTKNQFFKDTSFKYNNKNPIHRERYEGQYADTLIITSKFGCIDTAIRTNRIADTINVVSFVTGPKGKSGEYADCLPFTITFSDTTTGPGSIFTYEWNFGNGEIFIGRTPPPRLYDTAGVFEVLLKVTNEFGCNSVSRNSISALVKGDPAFIVTPDTVCNGDTVFIQMTNSSGASYTYTILTSQYSRSKIQSSRNYGTFNRYLDTGYHAVSVRVGDACDTTLVLDSAFYVLGPVIDLYAQNNCLNRDVVNFTSNAIGYTRFYWDFGDGSPLDSINIDPSHTYVKDSIFKAGLTIFNDSNRCGPYYDSVWVNLLPKSIPSRLPYKKEYCRSDGLVRLYFDNMLLGYDSSQWYVNDQYFGNFEDQYFPIDSFQNGRNNVLIVMTDPLGCKDTINDYLFVSNPRANFSSNISGGCIPFNVQFFDNSTSDTTIVSWEWIFSNRANDTAFIQNPIRNINTTDDIIIKLTVRDSIGCIADTTIDDLVSGGNLNIAFSTIQNTNICVGDSIRFFNRSDGDNLTSIWNFGDGTIDTNSADIITHQFNSPGSFPIQLVVIDQGNCIDSLSRYTVNVEDYPTANFIADTTNASCYPLAVNFTDLSTGNVNAWEWDLGLGDKINLQNPFRNFLDPGNYDISLIVSTPNGCSDTIQRNDYIRITGPLATFSMDKNQICLNEAITFSITSQTGVGSFRWAFGDGNTSTSNPATHIYTDTAGLIQPSLIILDTTGTCEVFIRDSLLIQQVIAKFSLEDTTGCEPFSPQITNLMQGEDSFIWDLGDGRQSTDRVPQFSYPRGSYPLKLSVSSNLGCSDESVIDIDVFEKPIASIVGDSSLCIGDSTTLTASGGIEYSWYIDNALFAMTPTIKVSPTTSTTYTVIIKNSFDCYDTAATFVYVQQAPANTPLRDTSIIIGEKLFPNVYAGVGYTYSWAPPEGLSCTDCPNPIIQTLKSREYIVTIADPSGCFTLNDTINIEVKEAFSLEVPNAFSPNGDGKNDKIFVEGWGLKKLISFKIFNRFGELVYEGDKFEEGWDGTYKGKMQPLETYVYTVEAETYRDEILREKGNITLLR